ncbi:hypothetical protein PUMCH_000692 [Australozyma saopauloensis]|uniref:RRM domain-containing protein n=1 Tax=Australozyma saopauloensis TaxID=291208 RepID=A0AAX4H5E8_9ASCO|nr:hypothetical protein PUMCH_000692 [[Candida] saopauloensis]
MTLSVAPISQQLSSSDVNAASATSGGRETSKTILYVGNLAKTIAEDQLKDIIQAAGPVVSVKILQDKNKFDFNYAFVEFETESGAADALQAFNNTIINGHEVKLNYAYQSLTFFSAQNADANLFSVFVGDLSPEVDDEALRTFFSEFPSLKQAHVMWDMQTSRSRGYGFATFKDSADAQTVIHTMNGRMLLGRAVRLNWASHKLSAQKSGGGGGRGYKKPFRQQMQSANGFDYAYGAPAQDLPYDNTYGFSPSFGNAMNDSYNNVYGAMYNGTFSPENGAPLGFNGTFTPESATYPAKYGDIPVVGYNSSFSSAEGYSDMSGLAPTSDPNIGGSAGGLEQVQPMPEPMMAPQFDAAARQAPSWQTTVYVGNIAYFTQESDLIPLLQNFGYILDLKFYPEKGCAFVKFDSHERAALAIVQLAGFNLNGRPLKCGWGKSRPPQNMYGGFVASAPQMFSGRQ